MAYENIEVRTEAGKVGIVTLNRPKGNHDRPRGRSMLDSPA